MAGTIRRALVIVTVFSLLLTVIIGIQVAHAATIEVNKPESLKSISADSEVEPSALLATEVYLYCTGKEEGGKLGVIVTVDGTNVGGPIQTGNSSQHNIDWLSFIVPAGTKFKWEQFTTGIIEKCEYSLSTLKISSTEGPEGKEGKEGKEGPEGKEGKEGKEGPEGKEGSGGGWGLGIVGSGEPITSETEYEPSKTHPSLVYFSCVDTAIESTEESFITVKVDGVQTLHVLVDDPVEVKEGWNGTIAVGAGKKWEATLAVGWTCEARTQITTAMGGGGASGGEVTKFGPEAESTVSELGEHLEILIWCLIGTIIASVIFIGTREMLRIR